MAAKKAKKESSGDRGAAREAIFALFDKRGVESSETSDDVVIAEAKKHGREPSHNAVVKYRSLYRLERGIAPKREGRPRKEAKPKPAKAAAKPKQAKAAKPKAAKAAKPKAAKPKKSKGNSATEESASTSAVSELYNALDTP